MRTINRSLGVTLGALAALLVAVAPAAGAGTGTGARIYWASANAGDIGTANVDGTGVNQVLINTYGGMPTGVAVSGQYVYWTNYARNTIGRANLDGSDINENFITYASEPFDVAVDAQHIYWTSRDPIDGSFSVGRANIDGTDANEEYEPATADGAIAVSGGHLYWSGAHSIWRDTTARTDLDPTFIIGLHHPIGLAVSSTHIYWANSGGYATVGRARLDGTHIVRRLISDGLEPRGLALTPTALLFSTAADTIGQAGLGGTDVSNFFIGGASEPLGLAVLPASG